MFKKIFGFLGFAVLLFSSCNSNGCYDEMDVRLYCGFYRLSDSTAVFIDSISVWGVGSDSLVYNKMNLNELALELNPNTQETQYVIQVKQSGNTFIDTLSLFHTNQPWFQSMECGCMVFSTLDSCKTTGSIFQSASILDSKIINHKTEHVLLNL